MPQLVPTDDLVRVDRADGLLKMSSCEVGPREARDVAPGVAEDGVE